MLTPARRKIKFTLAMPLPNKIGPLLVIFGKSEGSVTMLAKPPGINNREIHKLQTRYANFAE